MQTYKCKFIGMRGNRAVVQMLDDHKTCGARAGETVTTSDVQFHCPGAFIVTRNSMYDYSSGRLPEQTKRKARKQTA